MGCGGSARARRAGDGRLSGLRQPLQLRQRQHAGAAQAAVGRDRAPVDRAALGVTSIVITHDMHAAFDIADRIAMLYKGRMIAVGSQAQIREYDHPVLQQMLTGSTKGPLTEGFAP